MLEASKVTNVALQHVRPKIDDADPDYSKLLKNGVLPRHSRSDADEDKLHRAMSFAGSTEPGLA